MAGTHALLLELGKAEDLAGQMLPPSFPGKTPATEVTHYNS